MLVTFRETNYKTVEVPDNCTVEELNAMVEIGSVVIGDATDADYHASLDNCKTWIDLSKYDY